MTATDLFMALIINIDGNRQSFGRKQYWSCLNLRKRPVFISSEKNIGRIFIIFNKCPEFV